MRILSFNEMNAKIYFVLYLVFYSFSVNAQGKPEILKLPTDHAKVANSLYDGIQVLDIRKDTTNYGMLQKGAFNRKVEIVAEPSLDIQLSRILNTLIDSSAQNGKLLLLIRHCRFAEMTRATHERGFFHFTAVLFSIQQNKYRKIAAIDTVSMVKSMFDVTKKTYRMGGEIMIDFIASYLTRRPEGNLALLADQLPKIDSIEKSRLPLYKANQLTNGLYYSYQSFAAQRPDESQISVSFNKKGTPKHLSFVGKKGEQVKVKSKSVYAFVYKHNAYISTGHDFYPLNKKSGDFYFTGKASNYTNEDITTAAVFFGLAGALLVQSSKLY